MVGSPPTSAVTKLGFAAGQVILELGYDDDVDDDLRMQIEDTGEGDLEDEDYGDVVDGVLLWWREEDGDLTDALVDSLRNIEAGAPVWLLTPKAGRPGHVAPGEVQESAEIAGLRVMSSLSLAADWTGTRLASRAK